MEDGKIKYQIGEDGSARLHTGNEIKKRKGTTSERDCLAKMEILTPLLDFPDGLTAKELFNISDYEGSYNNFTSHLSKYCRGGKKTRDGRMGDAKYVYLSKIGKRPAKYALTDFGKINAENPYLNRDEAIRVYKRKVEHSIGVFLNDNPKTLSQVVSQLSGMNLGCSGGSDGVRHTSSNDFGDSGDYHKNDEVKQKLLDEIKELKEDKETLEYQLELAENKPAKMVINQSPQPQQQEVKASNERSFDNVLFAYRNQRINTDAYKRLPKQIIQIIAEPVGDFSNRLKRLVGNKNKGEYDVASKDKIPFMIEHKLVRTLNDREIESFKMIFEMGYVYLVSSKAKFKITEVPKRVSKPSGQIKVRINRKNG
jgi:hypothetical protein